MKILVPVKRVPDPTQKAKIKDGHIDLTGASWIVNTFDEYAVETALRLLENGADGSRQPGEIVVVSLGPDDAAKEISERVTVKRTSGQDTSFDNLIDITFLHADPKVAETVVDALVKAYGAYLKANRETNSEELYTNLTGQLKDAERTIRELDKEYHDWRNAAPFFLATPVIVTAQGTAVPGESPYMVEITAAAPDISSFMVSIFFAPLSERPPLSNVTPLPTRTTCFLGRCGGLYSMRIKTGGSSEPRDTAR